MNKKARIISNDDLLEIELILQEASQFFMRNEVERTAQLLQEKLQCNSILYVYNLAFQKVIYGNGTS